MLGSDEAKYPVSVAAKIAAGMNVGTAGSWLQKKWIRLNKSDKRAKVAGATTLLSRRRVLQLAIAWRLAKAGLHPKIACAAAHSFTDLANSGEAPGFDRDPGELFANAITSLVVYEDGSCAVVRIGEDKDKKPTAFQQLHFPAGGQTAQSRYDAATSIMLDRIVRDVKLALDEIDRRAA
jgi:hypothetical protein